MYAQSIRYESQRVDPAHERDIFNKIHLPYEEIDYVEFDSLFALAVVKCLNFSRMTEIEIPRIEKKLQLEAWKMAPFSQRKHANIQDVEWTLKYKNNKW